MLADRIRTARRRVTGRQAAEVEETEASEPASGSVAEETATSPSEAAEENQSSADS